MYYYNDYSTTTLLREYYYNATYTHVAEHVEHERHPVVGVGPVVDGAAADADVDPGRRVRPRPAVPATVQERGLLMSHGFLHHYTTEPLYHWADTMGRWAAGPLGH